MRSRSETTQSNPDAPDHTPDVEGADRDAVLTVVGTALASPAPPPVATPAPLSAPPPVVPVARALVPSEAWANPPIQTVPRAPCEGCSIASAVCGLTAFIPVVSQVAGLGLGIAGLVRIQRARRRGVRLRGTGWAVAGLSTSAFGLISWIAVFAAFWGLSTSYSGMSGGLDALLNPTP